LRRAAPVLLPALLLALLPALALLLAGCPSRDRSGPGLYTSYCRRCHGTADEGPKRRLKLYPHLDLRTSPMLLRGDRAAVRQRIVQGDGPMPSFGRRLTPAEVERVVEFTLAIPHRTGR
jgi:mono/diheme cytochrome c family protein